ncbi:DUF5615 family PIN-like protein [Methylocystis sp. S23]
MRFLADENFPGEAVNALRTAGFDVLWICESTSGASDTRVLAMANAEERVLLTFDKDFGELAWRGGLSAACGVILFRLPIPPATSIGPALVARVRERDDWIGSFSVVEPGRVRMRRLAR